MLKFFAPLFAILLLFFLCFLRQTTFAADSMGSGSAVVSPTPMTEYTLPYPGILPDNPLYALKVFRDRLILFFIASPLKKSSFYLLQSDKRLAGAQVLLEQGGHDVVAIETLSKSTNYFQQSLESAREAKQNGELMNDLDMRLSSAIAKHVNVVMMLSRQAAPGVKQALNQEEKRLTDLQKAVTTFSQK